MTSTFFSAPFAHLHDDVFTFLAASPTIHAALPLLGVDRYWRKLTIRKLVKEFSRTKVEDVWSDEYENFTPLLSSGGYIKVHLSSICPQDEMRKSDDVRHSIARGHPGKEMWLLLDEAEAILLGGIEYDFPVRDDGEEYGDVVMGFSIVSSEWFRRSKAAHATYGLELGGRPERFPIMGSAGAGFFPKVQGPKEVENGNPRVTAREKEIGNGWKISWHTHRNEDQLGLHGHRRANVVLAVHQIEMPLIELFCPRKTASKEQWEKGCGWHDDCDFF